MKSENLLPVATNSDSLFEFRLPLTAQTLTSNLPQIPIAGILHWLDTIPQGRFQYIFDLGDLQGISFEKEEDAIQFKLTWL